VLVVVVVALGGAGKNDAAVTLLDVRFTDTVEPRLKSSSAA
jgi:hypothetical protein